MNRFVPFCDIIFIYTMNSLMLALYTIDNNQKNPRYVRRMTQFRLMKEFKMKIEFLQLKCSHCRTLQQVRFYDTIASDL